MIIFQLLTLAFPDFSSIKFLSPISSSRKVFRNAAKLFRIDLKSPLFFLIYFLLKVLPNSPPPHTYTPIFENISILPPTTLVFYLYSFTGGIGGLSHKIMSFYGIENSFLLPLQYCLPTYYYIHVELSWKEISTFFKEMAKIYVFTGYTSHL